MERNRASQNGAKRPNVNNSDFDFDDISFKPITKGLGFHHEKERPNARPFRPSPRPRAYTPTQRPVVNEVKLERVLEAAGFRERILAFIRFLVRQNDVSALRSFSYSQHLEQVVIHSVGRG